MCNRYASSQIAALWLLVIAAYLASTEFLTDLVEKGLGTFLPRLLGQPSLVAVDLPWLISLLSWRIPLCSILAALATISLVASSVAQTFRSFTVVKPTFYMQAMDRVNDGKEGVTGRIRRLKEGLRSGTYSGTSTEARYSLLQCELERLAHHLLGMGLDAVFIGITVSRLASDMAVAFVQNLVITLRRAFVYLKRLVRYLLVPVSSFSSLSVLIILTLSHYQAYNVGATTLVPRALWGEALTVMIAVLVLCGASFGFAPAIERCFIFAGTEAVAYLGGMIYVLLSLASLGLPLIWFGFDSAGVDFRAARPGPVFATNLVLCAGPLMALMLTVVPTILPLSIKQRFSRFESALSVLPIFFLMLFLGIALVNGLGPIAGTLSAALRQ